MTVHIHYTGDLIKHDGSDYADGEPCEEGTGFTVESGWVSPDWSRREVYAERDDVAPDTYDAATDGPLIDWLCERLDSRLSVIELSGNIGESTYYSGEADTDPYSGDSITLAAHIDGATPEVLAAVTYRLTFDRAQWRAGLTRSAL